MLSQQIKVLSVHCWRRTDAVVISEFLKRFGFVTVPQQFSVVIQTDEVTRFEKCVNSILVDQGCGSCSRVHVVRRMPRRGLTVVLPERISSRQIKALQHKLRRVLVMVPLVHSKLNSQNSFKLIFLRLRCYALLILALKQGCRLFDLLEV